MGALWLPLLLFLAGTSPAATHYVDASTTNASSPYSTWGSAAATIQDAVDIAAPGDEVVVADGLYATGAVAVNGSMLNRVAIPNAITVRSLRGPVAAIIAGNGSAGGSAVRCVYLGTNAMLDGFTLTGGHTQGTGPYTDIRNSGGGAWCAPGAVLTNCLLLGNAASDKAGGAYGGTLKNCVLTGNLATNYGGGAYKSVLYNCTLQTNSGGAQGGGASVSSLTNCTLVGNAASDGGGTFNSTLDSCILTANRAYYGGGGAEGGLLVNCTLSDNLARSFTGDGYPYGGGAYYASLKGCTITGNRAELGGGVAYCGLNNCTVSTNRVGTYGGGVYRGSAQNCAIVANYAEVFAGGSYDAELDTCTLIANSTGNIVSTAGGGFNGGTLRNCIIMHNWSQCGGGGGGGSVVNSVIAFNEASVAGSAVAGPIYLNNCTVVGNSASYLNIVAYGAIMNNCIYYYNFLAGLDDCTLTNCCCDYGPLGNGNISAEPAFVDAATGNFRLQSSSPCINAGNNAQVFGLKDLDGNPRIAMDTVDIGAYEYQLPALGKPTLFLQPQSRTNDEGGSAWFRVYAGGVAPFGYQWEKNGAPLGNGGNITGARTNLLSLSNLVKADEGEYRVVITNSDGSITSSVATLTVIELPVAAIADTSLSEGDSGTSCAVFPVTLDTPSPRTVTVSYQTYAGTAGASDYVTTNGIVTFAPGVTNQSIQVMVKGDIEVEPEEYFTVLLSNPTNTLLGRVRGTNWIGNDDGLPGRVHHFVWAPMSSPQWSGQALGVAVNALDLSNNPAGSFTGTVTFGLSSAGATNVTISPAVSSAFAAGVWTGNVTLTGNATNVMLTATDAVGHGGNANAITVWQANDLALFGSATPSPVGVLSNLTCTLQVLNPGPSSATGVRLTNTLPTGVTLVSTQASQGTITANSGVIVFDLGTVTNGITAIATVVLSPTIADVVLTNTAFVARDGLDANPANNAVTSTIIVAPAVVLAGNAAVAEGDSGATNALFPLQLNAPSAKTVTVGYVTSDGTASAASDYVATNGVVTFAPGVTNRDFSVPVRGDITVEASEVFYAGLSVTNGMLSTNRVAGTILNDDGLPGRVHHFVWAPIVSPQHSGTSFSVLITAQDASNNIAASFTDPVTLSLPTSAGGEITIGTSGTTAPFPMDPEYGFIGPAERSQAIYLAGEIGGARRITALAVKVTSFSGYGGYELLNNWTIRLKHTDLSSYSAATWESSGWTPVYQTNLIVSGTGWLTFPFPTPFDYDGVRNLMVDFSFNNSAFQSSILCAATSLPGVRRTLWTFGFGDPLSWDASSGPMNAEGFPDIRLTCQTLGATNAIALSPTNTVNFTGGVWSGTVTLTGTATNLTLLASDAVGHTGFSNPFDVSGSGAGLCFDHSQGSLVCTNGGFTLRLTGCSDACPVVLLVSTNLRDWLPLCTNSPAAGTVEFQDFGWTNQPRRFYRAGQ